MHKLREIQKVHVMQVFNVDFWPGVKVTALVSSFFPVRTASVLMATLLLLLLCFELSLLDRDVARIKRITV